jgi:large subunit ribosomal protein L30
MPEVKKTIKKPKTNKKQTVKKQKTVKIKLIKSFYGRLPSHRLTVAGLGLKRINQTVELEDTKSIRGMINKVAYLLKVE